MRQNSIVYDVAVAGGGAAGLVAAISAARRGKSVILIEKNDRMGKKLLATGNGRCNLASSLPTKCRYNTDAVEATFSKVPLSRILGFFEGLGLVVREENSRIYPYSNMASAVLNALRFGVEEAGVRVLLSSEIKSVSHGKSFVLDAESGIIEARNLIFATGSAAGGGKDSVGLLYNLGHKSTDARPSLVPMLTDTAYIKGLRGVRAVAEATLTADKEIVKTVTDEILFKDNGVTGTAVFELSSAMARIRNAKDFSLILDFAPEYGINELAQIINGKMGAEGLFHKEIVSNIARYAADLGSKGDSKAFARAAKYFEIEIKGLSSFSLAQAASGGLEVSGFNFSTMESKLCKGLYAAGEALDVDGDCGGFNLMWAWASGILAGESIQ